MRKMASILLSSIVATSTLLPVATQTTIAAQAQTTSAGVTLPLMLSNVGEITDRITKQLKSGNGRQMLVTNYYDKRAFIQDMATGQVLRTLFTDVQGESVAVNEKENLFIGANQYELFAATPYTDEEAFDIPELQYGVSELDGFIGNTNQFVGKTLGTELFAYDYDKKRLMFTLKLPHDWAHIAVGQQIVVAHEKTAIIYDDHGEYVEMLQFPSPVLDVAFSPDQQTLVVATEGQALQFYDAQSYRQKMVAGFAQTDNSTDITYDPTGTYMAVTSLGDAKTKTTGFRLFHVATGDRIYTDLDHEQAYENPGNIGLSNNAQFVFYGKHTYNGKNVNVYATGLADQTYTLHVDEGIKPEALVQYSDGTTKKVTEGVSWKSSDLSKGYFDEATQTFKVREAGTFKVQVSYAGFTQEVTIEALPNETPVLDDVSNALNLPSYMDGNYYNDGLGLEKLYLDQRVYRENGYRYATHVAAFTGETKNGGIRTYLDVARKASTALNMKKIVLKANGKSLTKKVTSRRSGNYEYASKVLLSASDLKWINKNVKATKSLKIQFVGAKKSVTKTLNATQKKSLLENVALNAKWKALQ